MTTWAIVPVKPLRDGKSRLSRILTPNERAELTTNMLRHTLEVLAVIPTIFRTLVVSRDPAVLKIARQYNAFTLGEGEDLGLNIGLTRGAHIAVAQQASSILILPADLPMLTPEDVELIVNCTIPAGGRRRSPNNLTSKNGAGERSPKRLMAICPDHLDDGTNALFLDSPLGFEFKYGPKSYHRHMAEALRLGIEMQIVHATTCKFDLDTEDDWFKYLVMDGKLAPHSALVK